MTNWRDKGPRGEGEPQVSLSQNGMAQNVTAQNYEAFAKAFFAKGKSVVICRDAELIGGTEYPARPDQFAAWLAYRKSIGLRSKGIVERGYIQVPTEWPSGFDAGYSIGSEYRERIGHYSNPDHH
jgi:hypothetical protein